MGFILQRPVSNLLHVCTEMVNHMEKQIQRTLNGVLQKACALDTAHRNRAMIGILLAFTFFVAEHVYEQRTATYSMERIRANQPTDQLNEKNGRVGEKESKTSQKRIPI